MCTMSLNAEINPPLSNHCVRASSVTLLSDVNVETRHIKCITGHKSDTSVESYSTKPLFQQTQRENVNHSQYNLSRSQRPRSFWPEDGDRDLWPVQHRKSAIHRLPITLRMPRVRSDKSDWFWSQSIVFTEPFRTGMSLDLAGGPDFQRVTKREPGG